MEGMLGDYANLWIIGQPIDINYNLKTIGVWQLDEAEEAAKYGCKPGQYKVLDLNGDGAINDADRVIDGKRTPSLTGGMTNNLVYKNFDLSIGSAFQTGARLKNQFLVSYCLENNNMNLNNLNRNYWTPENPTNEWAQPGNMGTYQERLVLGEIKSQMCLIRCHLQTSSVSLRLHWDIRFLRAGWLEYSCLMCAYMPCCRIHFC